MLRRSSLSRHDFILSRTDIGISFCSVICKRGNTTCALLSSTLKHCELRERELYVLYTYTITTPPPPSHNHITYKVKAKKEKQFPCPLRMFERENDGLQENLVNFEYICRKKCIDVYIFHCRWLWKIPCHYYTFQLSFSILQLSLESNRFFLFVEK